MGFYIAGTCGGLIAITYGLTLLFSPNHFLRLGRWVGHAMGLSSPRIDLGPGFHFGWPVLGLPFTSVGFWMRYMLGTH